jgi:uncharacterized Zn-finger protein
MQLEGSNLSDDISSPVRSLPPHIIVNRLVNHMIGPKIIGNTKIDLYRCDLCSNSSSTKLALERHMKQIHQNKSNGFTCEVCQKTFAKKVVLQSHMKIHLEYRPTVECEICGKSLSSPTALASHIKWLHSETRDFECKDCSKMFATVRSDLC